MPELGCTEPLLRGALALGQPQDSRKERFNGSSTAATTPVLAVRAVALRERRRAVFSRMVLSIRQQTSGENAPLFVNFFQPAQGHDIGSCAPVNVVLLGLVTYLFVSG